MKKSKEDILQITEQLIKISGRGKTALALASELYESYQKPVSRQNMFTEIRFVF